MNFNIRQKKVIEAKESKILCLAAAASGKTAVLTERVRRIINDGCPAEKIACITFTTAAAEEMRQRLGSISYGAYIGTIHGLANSICISNGINTEKYIADMDFNKIIEKAMTLPRSRFPKYEHVLVDEFQDTCEFEYNFIDKIPKNNFCAFGDERQCQPEGTKIKMRDGTEKNIEQLCIGDYVMTYNSKDGSVRGGARSNYTGGLVEEIASRNIQEEVISITTEDGFTSKYTDNHKCMVKLNENSPLMHAVYLMCDDNYRFRIGKIPFFNIKSCHKNPWRDKMYKEGCSKIWILKLFDNDKDARVLETKLSYKYQIPQTCWQTDKVLWTKDDIEYIYEGLNTYNSAKKCLEEFHRNIKYPLIDKNLEISEHIHFAKNAITQIYACNLMEDVMEVVVFDEETKTRKHYSKINKIDYTFMNTKVYSLRVTNELYFADNILTHNCIYGFKGTSDRFLRELYNDPTCKTYYLIDNYRNPPNILAYADDLISTMHKISLKSVPAKTEKGYLQLKFSFSEALEHLEASGDWGNWFVLCRTNNELATAMSMLEERDIPCVSFKKSDLDLDELSVIMKDNRVKVLTIHVAKGLQNKHVIVTGARMYNEDERKVSYVAATRAEQSLYWTPSICKRGYKNRPKNRDQVSPGRIFEKSQKGMVSFE